MEHLLIIGAHPRSLLNFRGQLISAILENNYCVTAMASEINDDVVEKLKVLGAGFCSYRVDRNGLNPLADFVTLKDLVSVFKELQPNLILAYTIKPIIWGGLASYVLPNVRFYALITGLGFAFQGSTFRRKALNKLVSFLYKLALSRAKKVIFQNKDNMRVFVENGIVPRSKCAVVNGSGVDTDIFEFTGLPEKQICFLSIGRLLGEKGFREYALAAKKVKGLYPYARFQLVGPTDPSPDGIKLAEIQNWHERGWVEYLGSADDIIPCIKNCHVYVLPSYHEGMPRTVLEAMAIGRPIITTDVPGCRETVVHEHNGFLVPKANVQELVDKMVWFIENSDHINDMGKKSRKLAEEKFDVVQVNKEMLQHMEL